MNKHMQVIDIHMCRYTYTIPNHIPGTGEIPFVIEG